MVADMAGGVYEAYEVGDEFPDFGEILDAWVALSACGDTYFKPLASFGSKYTWPSDINAAHLYVPINDDNGWIEDDEESAIAIVTAAVCRMQCSCAWPTTDEEDITYTPHAKIVAAAHHGAYAAEWSSATERAILSAFLEDEYVDLLTEWDGSGVLQKKRVVLMKIDGSFVQTNVPVVDQGGWPC
jgi:hypothetical protein